MSARHKCEASARGTTRRNSKQSSEVDAAAAVADFDAPKGVKLSLLALAPDCPRVFVLAAAAVVVPWQGLDPSERRYG